MWSEQPLDAPPIKYKKNPTQEWESKMILLQSWSTSQILKDFLQRTLKLTFEIIFKLLENEIRR